MADTKSYIQRLREHQARQKQTMTMTKKPQHLGISHSNNRKSKTENLEKKSRVENTLSIEEQE